MAQATSGRIAFSMIVGLLSAALAASCGSTSPKKGGDDEPEGGDSPSMGDAGEGPQATGGTPSNGSLGGRAGTGVGGNLNSAGRPMTAGRGGVSAGGNGAGAISGGGTSAGGGSPVCVTGVPCKCGKAVGVTECEDDEESCSCPPAAECTPEEPAPCFEACGGEPFGAWVVEETCFGGTTESGGCTSTMRGTSKDSNLRLRILDGGELWATGSAEWDIDVTASLDCLKIQSVNTCEKSTLFSNAAVLSSAGVLTCEPNACGVCDCSGQVTDSLLFGWSSWQRQGTTITLDGITTDYCVQGDEMWIGGNDNGTPKLAYKLRKESCIGTPKACAERSADECTSDQSCTLGSCVATSGAQSHCANGFSETQCTVIQGCKWEPESCTGQAHPFCEFDRCDVQPGCSWGPPTSRCGGGVLPCESRAPETCESFGCTLRKCYPNGSETGECSLLTAAECANAPGCTVSSGTCTGTARCASQTDSMVCSKLNCAANAFCEGTATECHQVPLADCHDAPGCRIEW